jgi:regulator of sigma E protease
MRESTKQMAIVTNLDTVRLALDDSTNVGDVYNSLVPFLPAVVDSIVAGMPAAAAGLQPRDSIVAIGGEPIRNWTDMTRIVGASAGKELVFSVSRSGSLTELRITPKGVAEANPATGKTDTVGKVGASRVNVISRTSLGFGAALVMGGKETKAQAVNVVTVVRDLFTGRRSVKELGGPIAITKVSVREAKSGWIALFELIAMLSINIAILNLLPIPILDGGQVVINIIETAKGSPFTMRSREMILKFGLVAIGLLFAVVMYNDTKGGFVWLWQRVVGLF